MIFYKKCKKRILENKGETLAETLVAMLIIVLSFTMLAGAITSVGHINSQKAKDTPQCLVVSNSNTIVSSSKVTINGEKVDVVFKCYEISGASSEENSEESSSEPNKYVYYEKE